MKIIRPSSRRGDVDISEPKFRRLISRHLLPLLPGASINENASGTGSSRETVTFHGPCTLSLKPSVKSDFHVEVTRSQPFANASTIEQIAEYTVAKSFVRAIQRIAPGLGQAFERDILLGLGRRIVARAIAQNSDQLQTALAVLDQFTRWAARSYEGKPISAAIGITEDTGGNVEFYDLCQEDFSAVLTNGTDTMIECSADGKVQRYHALSTPGKLPDFAPHRLAALAEWSRGGRIALALNRSGEVLVFKHSRLVFVCRRGKWSFMTHEPIITQMGCPHDKRIRRAIYSSALDASFARTGAGIGVVTSGYVATDAWKKVVPKPDDRLESTDSTKTKALLQMIGKSKFQDIDRRFRQELLAIDGATLIAAC